MINSLLWIYDLLANNFGLAIIAFTIIVRLITYPLTAQQMKSTQKMQEMQKSKKWQEVQKKYKDDREKLSQEQMKLYREMGINPFGSCLPTIIQFPIIIGLYQAVVRALAVTPMQLLELFAHIYPFIPAAVLIPLNNYFLWMDLSQPEKDYGITIAGFGIPILAILVIVSTYLQSKLMTPPSTGGEQGANMTRAMNLYMPLFMGYLAYSFPSGLALYFVTSNLVGILQYAIMGKLNWRNLLPIRTPSK
jgi:YidC/Oxa1 family membrane protein insertase